MDSYPLGISSKTRYTDGTVELSLGDTLIFHTDGLVEACNRQEEMYGYARMEKSVLRSCQDNVSSIGGINRMVGDAHRFMGSQEQADDITLVIAKVTG
jgi:sigma-B regulation protein RsbU (phosphoserine phosphatase)